MKRGQGRFGIEKSAFAAESFNTYCAFAPAQYDFAD